MLAACIPIITRNSRPVETETEDRKKAYEIIAVFVGIVLEALYMLVKRMWSPRWVKTHTPHILSVFSSKEILCC